jgi:nicotinate-nucleotide adenylyltransferase
VWLLVSPGNPLKPAAGMAPFSRRLQSAAGLSDPPRIVATDLEARLGTRFSADTITVLRRRFPRTRFVWLMGADSWVDLPRWRRWRRFAAMVPIAVHARPGADHAALAALPSQLFRRCRVAGRAAPALAGLAAPRWMFLPLAPSRFSATALRAAGRGLKPDPDPLASER